jgi:lysophospholipase L1-like esterase
MGLLDAPGYTRTATDQRFAASPWRYDSTNGRAFRAALGKRATSPVDILAIGDSVTEGQGVTSPPAGRWLTLLRDQLRTAFPAGVTGGAGYIPSQSTISGYTSPVAYTGTASNLTSFGLGLRCKQMSSGATATLTFTGTGVDIVYVKGSSASTFTWAVDGGSTTNVNTNGATSDGNVAQIRGLSAASHTLVVTATANYIFLDGFMVYNGDEAAGIRVWDAGHAGFRSADFSGASANADGAYNMQPDLVSIELGINDKLLTIAAARTNLEAIISRVRAKCTVPPTIVLWKPWMATPWASGAVDTWTNYLAMLEALAKADGKIGIFDPSALIGDLTADNSYGMGNADLTHPSNGGHQALADAFYRMLVTP